SARAPAERGAVAGVPDMCIRAGVRGAVELLEARRGDTAGCGVGAAREHRAIVAHRRVAIWHAAVPLVISPFVRIVLVPRLERQAAIDESHHVARIKLDGFGIIVDRPGVVALVLVGAGAIEERDSVTNLPSQGLLDVAGAGRTQAHGCRKIAGRPIVVAARPMRDGAQRKRGSIGAVVPDDALAA